MFAAIFVPIGVVVPIAYRVAVRKMKTRQNKGCGTSNSKDENELTENKTRF